MLSIVLYGRNDSYGYNLHKRAALGLNCMAELLGHADDEILFVDYNTPDDFPTFPEAIADTLTATARRRLRVLRVRPAVHERFRHQTHLLALEPIARNVAVRRSNPANRWILSTNTDMIFVSRDGVPLSEAVADLPAGFYHLPRFELPESLWEGFDRLDPVGVMRQVEHYGRSLCLNEIVYGSEYIKYDAPGDFQLMLRDDLFAIDGFDEAMLLGWHVDSNIARRLYLRYRTVGDIVGRLFGYHCDHTRQVTPAHAQKAPSNDSLRFVEQVRASDLPGQRATWGCAHDTIEEIRLEQATHHAYVRALGASIRGEYESPREVPTTRTLGRTAYDARHVLPFLLDLFAAAPRTATIGWIGGRADMLAMFATSWQALGFTGEIVIDEWSTALVGNDLPPFVRATSTADLDAHADGVVFDFAAPSGSSCRPYPLPNEPDIVDQAFEDFVGSRFVEIADSERRRMDDGRAPRRFICIDSIHNRYQELVNEYVGVATAPFSTRVRHGFVHRTNDGARHRTVVFPPPALNVATSHTMNLLPMMRVGDGGADGNGRIVAPFGRRGYVCRGPSQMLSAGDYRADFTLTSRNPLGLAGAFRPVLLDATIGAERIAGTRATFPGRGTVSLRFTIPSKLDVRHAVEIRVFRGRYIDFVITGATLTRSCAPLRTAS